MPEQDELFTNAEGQNGRGNTDAVAGERSAAAAPMEAATAEPAPSARVGGENAESIDSAGGETADGKVRVVELPVKTTTSNRLLLLLLLAVVLLSGGLFLLNHGFNGMREVANVATEGDAAQPPIRLPIERPVEDVVMDQHRVAAADRVQPVGQAVATATVKTGPAAQENSRQQPLTVLYSVLVGPYLSSGQLDAAAAELKKLGFAAKQTEGRGVVTMTRLLEGVYPAQQAHRRLAELQKTVKSAFLLPAGGKLALYVGSFADPERASRFKAQLAGQGLRVEPVVSDIEMNGKMLLVVRADRETAGQIAARIAKSGFKTQVVSK